MRFLSLGFVLLCIVLLCLAGCSATVHSTGYGDVTRQAPESGPSLFPEMTNTISDEDIGRILDTPWYIPEAVRVAVVSLGHDSEFGYRQASWLTGAMPVPAGEALLELKAIPVIYDASYLPSFLLPEKMTVPRLREAAVRYQADWVLIYNTKVRSKYDTKFLAKDEVKGVCLVECALLDVRTGLITFTGSSLQEFMVKEGEGGDPLPLLVARAEQEAVDQALWENTQGLGELLQGLHH